MNPDGFEWDREVVGRAMAVLRPLVKGWHRSEVSGFDRIPDGGALLVGNHSGGLLPMDIPILAVGFFDHFGYDRPLLALAHDVLFRGPQAELFRRAGLIPADRAAARRALRAGAAVIVFPGGDHDAFRPSWKATDVDFGGRTGYVTTALAAGVPIVPVVSIGGQQSQLFLGRGEWIGRRLGLHKVLRTDVVPLSIGFPFGVAGIAPVNLPLPTKIVTQILEPVDIVAQFGADPDPVEVDAHVRTAMQAALEDMASRRRFPVIG